MSTITLFIILISFFGLKLKFSREPSFTKSHDVVECLKLTVSLFSPSKKPCKGTYLIKNLEKQ